MNKLHKNLTLILLVFYIFNFSFSQDNNQNLRVITYNIQTASNYRDDTPQNIDTLLNDWEVDILGTQELHMEQVTVFNEELAEYDWFGVARLDGDTDGETCVIFYNKNRLELLDHSTFWLSTNPDKIGSRSWDAAFPRIVTWGKFRMKSNNAIFFAYNTHFDHYGSLAREESAKLLKNVINEEAGFHPVLALGDFNCRPDSTPYNFMLEHDDNILNLHDSKLVSEQGTFGPEGTSNQFTIDNPTKRIDYIFVNSLFNVKNYGVINEKPGGEFISDHFPVYSELEFNLPSEPVMPELTSYAGDGKVTLSWDKMSEKTTYDESILDYNDFQGYKLYRSRDPEMSDALINPGLWHIPIMRQPELVCDKIDDKRGYTNYGIVDGFGYYLGEDSGLQHFYIDDSVENGETYYYVLTAYDHGIDSILHGYQPLENSYSIEMDNGQTISQTKNTAIVTPKKYEENTTLPAVEFDTSKVTVGNFDFTIEVFDPNKIIPNKEYKLNFLADTLPEHAVDFYQHPFDMLYLNNGFEIRSVSNDSLILREDIFNYTSNNIVYDRLEEYYHFRRGLLLYSDVFEGLQLSFQRYSNFASFASQKTGWIEGNANIVIDVGEQSRYLPWEYEIIFTDNPEEYTTLTNQTTRVCDINGEGIDESELILDNSFNFFVLNKSFLKEDITYEKLDLVVHDKDMNGEFNRSADEILVGYYRSRGIQYMWAGTVFSINFSQIENQENMPGAGDIYRVDFHRPYLQTDQIYFSVDPDGRVVATHQEQIAREFKLQQNYPNPFNSQTRIDFQIPQSEKVILDVYNILGQKVDRLINKTMNAGHHSVDFNASGLSSGVYFYTLKAGQHLATNKMLHIK